MFAAAIFFAFIAAIGYRVRAYDVAAIAGGGAVMCAVIGAVIA